ncbi:vacuolar protein 14 C-terminal Fig4p binding-domain-containing protein [Globomyces pollinis-pini]|nr:vacuolar protein 14 C-terminal Fig4p binding-domain-containing protein [Globomyces pollinis-pini]
MSEPSGYFQSYQEKPQGIITAQIARGLSIILSKFSFKGDKQYEKRKIAALEIEKIVRDAASTKDHQKIHQLLNTLIQDYAYSIVPNSRNGGLIALAATAIALGSLVQVHLKQIIPPILSCFSDHDSRVRYYACEAMYNVGKVARGAILQWFNEIFDALTKLSTDVELSVKNGAELLDRLMKDVVSEKATYYHPDFEKELQKTDMGGNSTSPNSASNTADSHPLSLSPPPTIFPPGSTNIIGGPTTFNLPRFIPLLKERIHVINAPGRLFLVQWIFVLNSIPDLELLSFLPEFLDGLFVYLSDSNIDVRTATLNVLGEFLKEITQVMTVQKEHGPLQFKLKNESNVLPASNSMENLSISTHNPPSLELVNASELSSNVKSSSTAQASESYVIGHGITINFGLMTEILAKYLSSKDEETQATALRWINLFISLAKNAMLPFTPLLLSAILPILSHSVDTIRSLAIDANTNLFTLVLDWSMLPNQPSCDPFDIVSTVGTLMQLFQDVHEDTRVGSLEWLLMLHKKYPKKVMNSDQTIFQGLLKTLSDYSEEVVRRDLQLLAQISHSSDDEYFTKFMVNLLNLFTIDRRLLETRGSLIIRQLCLSLNPERMYRSFGEILEQEQDLEFATTMVQTLNLILITAPELNDMRRRLKNIESKDGALLFTALYRSWCHNPIAVFSLCLLSQAYEHASNLMTCFGDLEITVQFLIQTDKLVQLLESPIFTSLRLQLLEPEKFPHLYKCLYGILMLLPQSSAFVTLRNRLNSINSLAMWHATPPLSSSTSQTQIPVRPSSKTGKSSSSTALPTTDSATFNIRWNELLQHFKLIQARHDRCRRAINVHDTAHEEDVPLALMKRDRSESVPNVSTSSINQTSIPSLGVSLSRFSRSKPPSGENTSKYSKK